MSIATTYDRKMKRRKEYKDIEEEAVNSLDLHDQLWLIRRFIQYCVPPKELTLQKFINNRAEWKSILHTEIFKKTRWNFPKHEKFTPNMLKDISEVVVLFSEQFIREANINTTPVQKSLKDDLMQRKNAES